jgi:hypothetical protein
MQLPEWLCGSVSHEESGSVTREIEDLSKKQWLKKQAGETK